MLWRLFRPPVGCSCPWYKHWSPDICIFSFPVTLLSLQSLNRSNHTISRMAPSQFEDAYFVCWHKFLSVLVKVCGDIRDDIWNLANRTSNEKQGEKTTDGKHVWTTYSILNKKCSSHAGQCLCSLCLLPNSVYTHPDWRNGKQPLANFIIYSH